MLKLSCLKKTVVALSVCLVLTACGESSDTKTQAAKEPVAQNTAPATTTPTERYAVGVDVSYPPFTNSDEQGNPIGFEIEILKAIAEDQKFGLDLVAAKRNSLYPDLEIGKYQILSASLKPNPERLTKSDFTEGFAQSDHTILSRKDKVAKSGQELPALGGVTAVQATTNSQKQLEDVGAKMSVHPSLFMAFKEFMAGNADHVTGDSVALVYYLEKHAPDKLNDYVFHPFDETGNREMAYAVTKGDTNLLNKMNAGLKNIKANGKYDEIYNRYFTTPNASTNKK